jgi:hypothetical protein
MGLANTTTYFCLAHRATFELSSDDRCLYGEFLSDTGANVTPCSMVRGWFVWHTNDERPPK